jgi:hypothetical protein
MQPIARGKDCATLGPRTTHSSHSLARVGALTNVGVCAGVIERDAVHVSGKGRRGWAEC